MQRDQVSAKSIANLCNFCDRDPQAVQAELEQFRHAYRAVQDIIPVDDLISGNENVLELKLDDAESGGESDDESNTHLSTGHWIESSYAKLLRLIWQLSSYPTLTTLLKTGIPL
jgi:hypothetical protein